MADVLGTFEQAILLAIVRLGAHAYGRRVLNDLEDRLDREVAAGAVYATLERLESKGLATSKLIAGTALRDGRVRRHFVVTAAGVRALNDARKMTDHIWHGLTWPLKGRS